jgi:hypothetical protein
MRKKQMMKSIIGGFLFLCAAGMQAQTDSSRWNVQLGVVTSWSNNAITEAGDLDRLYSEYEKGRLSNGLEVLVEKPLNKKLSLQTGLRYQTLGYQVDTIASIGVENIKYSFSTVQIPVFVKYNISSFETIQPFVSLGAQYGYVLNSTQEFKLVSNNQTTSSDIKEGINKSMFFGGVKAGLDWKVITNQGVFLYGEGMYQLNSFSTGEVSRSFYNYGVVIGWKKYF